MKKPDDVLQTLKALKTLRNGGELVVKGELWTKFEDPNEFKVSPRFEQGDYDKESYWVNYVELDEMFDER